MTFKVWRKKNDNSLVGYCEATYTGFEPGGDLTAYVTSIESVAPTMPTPTPSAKQAALTAALADATLPATLKTLLPLL